MARAKKGSTPPPDITENTETTPAGDEVPRGKKPRKVLISCYLSPDLYEQLNELATYRTRFDKPTGYGNLIDYAVAKYLESKQDELTAWREYAAALPPAPKFEEEK